MTLLTRYLLRQNMFLLLAVLLVGTGLYLLTDLFERMDNFLETGLPFSAILFYFAVKTPSIISQILPAVFLLALVVQLNILDRSREQVALASGGISPWVLVRFILIYGLVWSAGQLFFSQVAGVAGDRAAARIWQEQVKGRALDSRYIDKLWFTEDDFIIHVQRVYPTLQRGEAIQVYMLGPDRLTLSEIIQAQSFTIRRNAWELHDVSRLTTATFSSERLPSLRIPIRQDIRTFEVVETSRRPGQLHLWELGTAIASLEAAGTNVDSLKTAWHAKLAYACSLVVMGLMGMVISQMTANVYRAVGLSLLVVFAYYSLNTLCGTMGSMGILSPLAGAWFADALFFVLALLRLAWPAIRRRAGTG